MREKNGKYEVTYREVCLYGLINDGSDRVVGIGISSGDHDVDVKTDDRVLLNSVRCSLPAGGALLKM